MNVPTEHQELFAVFKTHYVSVFGGYIRDIIAGDKPNDIDCAVEHNRVGDLCKDLIALGYTITKNEEMFVCTHDTLLPLDLLVAGPDISTKESYLGPSTIPDYSVNLLAYGWDCIYDRYGLYVWTCDAEVNIIIDHIINRVCLKHPMNNIDQEEYMKPREDKILSKGYRILE